jgi:general nucleoside transport system ATP-binding protein
MSGLRLSQVGKQFGDFSALTDVSLTFGRGSITAVLGENGAGKTTLMNILYGLYQPTTGEVRLEGRALALRSPKDAIACGIGMIHQHFHLAPALTVAENVLIGAAPPWRRVDLREQARAIRQLGDDHGFDIDPQAAVWKLPMGMQQRAEILKALYRKARVLILDEPTSVLAPTEVASLLSILARLRDAGTIILFVTHKLDEVFSCADRVAVMRQGRLVFEAAARDTSAAELSRQMVGRELPPAPVASGSRRVGPARLRLGRVCARSDRGTVALDHVDLEVRGGEVLGVTGVDGNGQRELAEVIAGLRQPHAGSIELDAVDVTHEGVRERLHRRGLGYVPEDRHTTGLVLDHPVWMGFFLRAFYRRPASAGGLMLRRRMRERAAQWVQEYDCRLRSIEQPARELSGGNQQKVILAREIEAQPAVLVVSQATKGLDIGAIDFVQRKILEQRERGTAVLYVSTELEHVLEVADRVSVMYRGTLSAPIDRAQLSMERIGALMSGSAAARAA